MANCARPVPWDGSVTSVEAGVLQKCADQYCDHVKGCFLKIENTTRLFASGKTNNKRGKRIFLKMFFISSINLFFFLNCLLKKRIPDLSFFLDVMLCHCKLILLYSIGIQSFITFAENIVYKIVRLVKVTCNRLHVANVESFYNIY